MLSSGYFSAQITLLLNLSEYNFPVGGDLFVIGHGRKLQPHLNLNLRRLNLDGKLNDYFHDGDHGVVGIGLLYYKIHHATDLSDLFYLVPTQRMKPRVHGHVLRVLQANTVDLVIHGKRHRSNCEIFRTMVPSLKDQESIMVGEYDDHPRSARDVSLSKCGDLIEIATPFTPKNWNVGPKSPGSQNNCTGIHFIPEQWVNRHFFSFERRVPDSSRYMRAVETCNGYVDIPSEHSVRSDTRRNTVIGNTTKIKNLRDDLLHRTLYNSTRSLGFNNFSNQIPYNCTSYETLKAEILSRFTPTEAKILIDFMNTQQKTVPVPAFTSGMLGQYLIVRISKNLTQVAALLLQNQLLKQKARQQSQYIMQLKEQVKLLSQQVRQQTDEPQSGKTGPCKATVVYRRLDQSAVTEGKSSSGIGGAVAGALGAAVGIFGSLFGWAAATTGGT